jgi:Holliday junction resolvasome RuvABC endonuclease subunit
VVLSLDPATKTGYCLGDGRTILDSGVWTLPRHAQFDPEDSAIDRRPAYLSYRIAGLVLDGGVESLAYEEVNPSTFKSKAAATVYLGLRGAIHHVAAMAGLPMHPYSVSCIKKHVAGRGNATKEQVMQSVALKFPKIGIIDDNHSDALAIHCLHFRI